MYAAQTIPQIDLSACAGLCRHGRQGHAQAGAEIAEKDNFWMETS